MEVRPDNVTTEMSAASGRFSILHYLDNGVSAIERALNYIAVGLIIVFMFFSTANHDELSWLCCRSYRRGFQPDKVNTWHDFTVRDNRSRTND